MNSPVFDKRIESLRGYCAIMVMVSHLSGMTWFDDHYNLSKLCNQFTIAGHIYVLVFFLISGYVIGLNYQPESFRNFEVKKYLVKRFVRIYPIYFIAVLLTLLISKESILTIFGNLLFLQNIVVDNVSANSPLWTLSHEIIYYALFALIAYLRFNPVYAFIVSVLLSFSCLFYPAMPAMVIALATGFSYWCVGLLIAWYLPVDKEVNEKTKERFYLPVLILLLICHKLNIFYGLIPAQHYNEGWGLQFKINIYDWIYFSFSVGALLVYSNRYHKILTPLLLISFGSVFLSMGYSIIRRGFSYYGIEIYCLVGLAVILCLVPIKKLYINKIAAAGSISFALYVIHTPLMHLGRQLIPYSSSVPLYLIKLVFYVLIVLLLSYLLEKVIQPRIKKSLLK